MINLLNFADDLDILVIIAGIVVLVLGLTLAVLSIVRTVKNASRADKRKQSKDAQDEEVSQDELLEEIEQVDDYFVLAQKVVYRIGKKGHFAACDYLCKSADGKQPFDIRVNDVSSQLSDNAQLTLNEGDRLCCAQPTLLKPL